MILQLDVLVFLREWAVFFAIYGVYVLSLNLEVGYLGLPQFGKVMFLALGGMAVGGIAVKLALWAYGAQIAAQLGIDPFKDFYNFCYTHQYIAVGIINGAFAANPPAGLAFFLASVGMAAGLAAALGVAFAGPALRLREDYLGILLLVSGELVRVFTVYTTPIACGTFGAAVPDPFAWVGAWRPYVYLAVASAFLAATLLVAERLANSPFGRALRAIRDAEVAARVFGKDLVAYRAKVLAAASALGGVAGALFTFYSNYVNMGQFVPLYTFVAWAMLVIGGMGNNWGALVGLAIYRAADALLSIYKENLRVVLGGVDPTYLQYVIFGVLVILVLMYAPRGVVPERPARTLSRRELEGLRARAVAPVGPPAQRGRKEG